jgi:hypothetical protein
MRIKLLLLFAISVLLPGCTEKSTEKYSRGIGIYPGNPDETYAPEMISDNKTYRNVAAFKVAYHSSSYDYNLTAQLVTDGIITTGEPASINVSTQNGDLKKNEREWLFDGKPDSRYTISGNEIYLQLDLNNMEISADKMVLQGDVVLDDQKPKGYKMEVYASENGTNWNILYQKKGSGYIGENVQQRRDFTFPTGNDKKPESNPSPVIFLYDYKPARDTAPFKMNFGIPRTGSPLTCVLSLNSSKPYKHYKVALKMEAAKDWNFNTWDFYRNDELQRVLPSGHFCSAWQSASAGKEWLYLDFGARAQFDKVDLHWINKAIKGKIQSSDDAVMWTDIAVLPGGGNREDVIDLGRTVKSRYIRLLMTGSEGNKPYILSEMQVFGKGGLVPRPHDAAVESDSRQFLSGGNWKLQRSSLVDVSGEEISKAGFRDDDWIPATVPGTVLSSFINIGAVPDPNFADNQLQISESYFLSDFWYRDVFTVSNPAKYVILNFNGINWKANVFLNGEKIGSIDGAFMRGKFDVSKQIVKGENVIAVQIIKNAHPGAIKEQTAYSTDKNGGIPGADNPTFHATIGWDWIPTIRGRDIGIWNDIFLTYSGAVTIEDPFIRTELPLPDTTSALVFVELTLKNHSSLHVQGTLKGKYGDATFEQKVELAPEEEKLVRLDAGNTPALYLKKPKLWWPKGYGAQYLYDADLSFDIAGETTDSIFFKSGVRQMTYSEDVFKPSGGMSLPFFAQAIPRRLSLFVNGRRFVGFGGNWGFSESNLNYRSREYDIAVAYHADMNFTMIRNWVGQTGDEEFYEACDRYGVMVWQDFWLANPVDGPDPYYADMFKNNAKDYIRRIRNHPSVGIYVGRNEGNPPEEIDIYLRKVIREEHPGLYYIPNSAMGVVSGGGPYNALTPRDYFRLYGHDKLHSERGMPNVMNYENLLRSFGRDGLEPVNTTQTPNDFYGLHDYTLGGEGVTSAQAVSTFNNMIEKAFGKPKDAKQFAEWAQWISYNGYRAIFEGRSEHRRGMLLWMSHPAWPSMVWQTYDYYFDPNGAYFGCKKACEPIHIQWNPLRNDIEVINYHAFDRNGLVARAQIFNQDGSMQWNKEVKLTCKEDQTVACFPLTFPETLTDTYFVKLTLTENGRVISENFYWQGKEEGNYQSLLSVPRISLSKSFTIRREGDKWFLTARLKNNTDIPAMMIRLKIGGSDSGEMILPAFFSDNYFFLMPAEEKVVTIRIAGEDTRGEKPKLEISGFNLL